MDFFFRAACAYLKRDRKLRSQSSLSALRPAILAPLTPLFKAIIRAFRRKRRSHYGVDLSQFHNLGREESGVFESRGSDVTEKRRKTRATANWKGNRYGVRFSPKRSTWMYVGAGKWVRFKQRASKRIICSPSSRLGLSIGVFSFVG